MLNVMSTVNEMRYMHGMSCINVNVDQIVLFVMINKDEIVINADVNVKN